MLPTLIIRGWKVHLLGRGDDAEECARWKSHERVEAVSLFAGRLRDALRGDALFLSRLRQMLAQRGMLLGAMQMSDAELIDEIYRQLRSGRMVAVECGVRKDADADNEEQPDAPRTTVPMEGLQIHLLFGEDVAEYCPYHTAHQRFRFFDSQHQASFVESLGRRQDMIRNLRDLLTKKMGPIGIWDASDETLLKRVVELMESGELNAFQCRGTTGGGGTLGESAATAAESAANKGKSGGSDSDKDDDGGKKKSNKDSEKTKTWIGIQLLDEEGNPAAFERYKIKLTDGTTQEGRLDGNGCAKFTQIDPGNCEITFPDFDAKEWKAA